MADRRHIALASLASRSRRDISSALCEFAFEREDESEILAHGPIGIGRRRGFFQRFFGFRQFFRQRVGKPEIGQNMRLRRRDFEGRRI